MPYIRQVDRDALDTGNAVAVSAGQLNYELTRLCFNFFKNNGGRYQQINDIIGALEGGEAGVLPACGCSV